MVNKTKRIEGKIHALSVDDAHKEFILSVFEWEAQATSDRGHYTKYYEEYLEKAIKAAGAAK